MCVLNISDFEMLQDIKVYLENNPKNKTKSVWNQLVKRCDFSLAVLIKLRWYEAIEKININFNDSLIKINIEKTPINYIELLIKRGADVNIKKNNTHFLFSIPKTDKNKKIIDFLLSKGADPNFYFNTNFLSKT
jgi:hypothetical protein